MRAGLIALGLSLALALVGCASPPTVFRADKESSLLTAPPLTSAAGSGVWVGPVEGDEDGRFRKAVAAALVARAVPAGVDRAGPLTLYLTAAPQPPTADGAGFREVLWSLQDRDGAEIDRFAASTPLDYRVERPETKVAIASVADRLASLLATPDRAAVAENGIAVAVPRAATEGFANGGPLSRAMTAALAERGFRPGAAEKALAVVRVAARATLATDDPATAFIAIRWAVIDVAGKQIGFVDQENAVPSVFLEDGLAVIAADAAAAAAPAVADLIQRAVASPSTGAGAS